MPRGKLEGEPIVELPKTPDAIEIFIKNPEIPVIRKKIRKAKDAEKIDTLRKKIQGK